jgi:hypothetical protein
MKQYLALVAILMLLPLTSAISYNWVYQETATAEQCSCRGTSGF